MAKNFYETIIASGGFAGESFDVAAGPANTAVIDTLLSVGDGILTIDCPISLSSTGALGAQRELDLTNTEQDGRIIFLSIRNTDIAANNLILMPTTSINGFGPTTGLIVSAAIDIILVHESSGVWRAYDQDLSTGGSGTSAANIFRATFTAADWNAGTANQITIIRTGIAGAGQIGPHNLASASSYIVQVYRDSDNKLVDTGVEVDSGTGNIVISKTGLGMAFNGRIMVVGD